MTLIQSLHEASADAVAAPSSVSPKGGGRIQRPSQPRCLPFLSCFKPPTPDQTAVHHIYFICSNVVLVGAAQARLDAMARLRESEQEAVACATEVSTLDEVCVHVMGVGAC